MSDGRMNPDMNAHDQEALELLAALALGDLSLDEAAPAAAARAANGDEAAAMEGAVGSIYLALAAETAGGVAAGAAPEPVPDEVLARLRRLGDAYAAAAQAPQAAGPARVVPASGRRGSRGLWFALAASLALAAGGWIMALRGGGFPSAEPGPVERRDLIAQQGDAVTIPWGEWSDEQVQAEVRGVTGEVVWSDQAQSGVMRLANLPDLPGSVYQLWIIDAERGMSQRVSGAVFQSAEGETWVEIEPQIPISKAAAFAVTIEQPGGTWVSDMTRRVVIAARPS
jgi:hypothetical protein